MCGSAVLCCSVEGIIILFWDAWKRKPNESKIRNNIRFFMIYAAATTYCDLLEGERERSVQTATRFISF